ncbi:HpcH/HpaI aldolase/citrate lyase family protein [Nonomuraea jiangxiensis]|uniref:Citrate lyase subunit beta / citryl-CoA lyase n=1 Tax=Nonomuraea jiangxiensis TaxID=633440 RepID=A0A1G8M5E5_9ACTN|nr:CoA ester lyase [Nonomuraea jiangxiensis]SDI63115.1 citrate lyase subunit beta / citryl-CoA lyase [Nonomuraea jiangxiensis]
MRARSWLFTPGDRPDRFGKAAAAGADVAILDLEDAVAPEAKAGARDAVAAALGELQAYVRVNGAETPWHEEDLRAVAGRPGLLGVMLPKAETPDVLDGLGVPVVALVETALGVENAALIAARPDVVRLAFGSVDFALDIGATEDDFLYARSRLVVVSRACRIGAPVDGVTTDLDDPDRTMADARRARALGFAGKMCLHPRQVGLVNRAFSPSEAELAWARQVVAAAGGGGAVRVGGQMIDKPRLESARRLLEQEDPEAGPP